VCDHSIYLVNLVSVYCLFILEILCCLLSRMRKGGATNLKVGGGVNTLEGWIINTVNHSNFKKGGGCTTPPCSYRGVMPKKIRILAGGAAPANADR